MEHLESGKMNGRELSVYTSIHFWADFKYGIAWKLSAPFLAKFLHEKEQIVKRCLKSLSSKGYIKRFNHRGQRTYYPILIDNYEIQKGIYTRADKTLNLDGLNLRVTFKCTLNVLQMNFKCPLNDLYVSPIKEVNNIRIIEEKKIINNSSDFPFENFWNDYDKKVGKKSKIESKWNKLKESEREEIMDHIPKYKLSQPDKQYRKNPETYLNNRGWEDEIIDKEPKYGVF